MLVAFAPNVHMQIMSSFMGNLFTAVRDSGES